MTTSADLVHFGRTDTGTLDPAALEREVALLWKEHEGPAAGVRSRACLSTLVVPVTGDEMPEFLEDVVRLMPSRVLLIHEHAEPGSRGAAAWVSGSCVRRPGETSWVCAETIHIQVGAGQDAVVASAVRSLAVGGVPLVVLADAEPPQGLCWLNALEDDVDLVLGESTVLPSSAAAELWRRVAQGASPRWADLRWVREAAARRAVAGAFDPPETAALGDVTEVRVATSGGDRGANAGWLFLGWLASRLGWKPVAPRVNGFRFAGARGEVRASIVGASGSGEPGLAGVEMGFSGGRADVVWTPVPPASGFVEAVVLEVQRHVASTVRCEAAAMAATLLESAVGVRNASPAPRPEE